ncbi:glutamate--tRNA ligase [bacterium]|nr:glutamate--tRNA ligase [bacterium]
MSDSAQKPIVRFAPSPTGNLHIGGARTALFNFLFARHYGGKFLLRIEDTDKERSKKEHEENIFKSLEWLGLKYDEEVVRQSERWEVYKKHLQNLLDSSAAYISKEEATPPPARLNSRSGGQPSPLKRGGGRKEVIRFKNPNKEIVFQDLIRGEIKFNTKDSGDFVIAKDLDTPLYHLAVVVDDFESGITHVIRGEDHISNTPRQILIQEAIGAPRPEYAHIPLILAPDKSKLSKRHGAVAVTEYAQEGYVPEALINYLALLGWNPGGDQEIFTLEELIEKFSLEKIQKSGAIFDKEKLNWVNREHLLKLSAGEREEEMRKFLPDSIKTLSGWSEEVWQRVWPTLAERIHVFSDVKRLAEEGELGFFFEDPDWSTLDKTLILPPKSREEEGTVDNSGVLSVVKTHIQHTVNSLSNIQDGEDFSVEAIKNTLWDYATQEGRGNVLWPMRSALTGRDKSPDPFTVASLIGKDATIRRLMKAIEILS